MSAVRKPQRRKRQALVEKATELFSRQGYRAVGIDRIIAESGVAKMTLYNHFSSKSQLVLEVLRQREEQAAQSMVAFVERYSAPHERIKAIFLWHEHWFNDPAFCGCMFIKAASEYPDHADAIHQAAAAQKRHTAERIGALLEALFEAAAAAALAEQFAILLDGATVTAQISGKPHSAMLAWEMAARLMENAGGRIG